MWFVLRTPLALRLLVILGAIAALAILTRTEVIDPQIVPSPERIVAAFATQVPTSTFVSDLGRTLLTVAIAFGVGATAGFILGVIGWRIPLVGHILEPYLVTLYAMPIIVFYPILLALLGLGAEPIIVIASVMALVPVAVNTTIALRAVNPVLHKLAASLGCSRRQLYTKVLIPSAAPLALPGVRLGFNFTLVYVIAMEFILGTAGLGFRIGYEYRQFEYEQMWGLIFAVALLAIAFDLLIGQLERRLRRDLSSAA